MREDFRKALGSLRHELHIRELAVSMASPEDVAAAIRSVREDVMVLIRGGGDPLDFRVFETPVAIKALGECASFRVLGLGHTKHRTLADCIADHTENVPSNAGRFLSEQVSKARLQSEQNRLENEQLQNKTEQLENNNKQLQNDRDRLHN